MQWGPSDETEKKRRVWVSNSRFEWVQQVGGLCVWGSGKFEWTPEDVAKALACMVLSGPLLTGYTQVGEEGVDGWG